MFGREIPIFCYWNGRILEGSDSLSYDGPPLRAIKVKLNIKFNKLLDKMYLITGFDREQVQLNLVCRYPAVVQSSMVRYIPLPVVDDGSVGIMLEIPSLHPSISSVELYLKAESIITGVTEYESRSINSTSAASPESNRVGSSVYAFGATSASCAETSSALPNNRDTAATPGCCASSVAPAPETKVLSSSCGTTFGVFSFRGNSASSSIGPIRRIRQKFNLVYNNGASIPTRGVGTVSAASKHQLFPTQEISKTLEINRDSATPSTSRFLVSTRSSETAAKILDHIDKLSPKEKASESKCAAIKGKSPTKLTTNMLHGQALRSLERLDSSRLLQSAPTAYEPENHSNATLPDAGDSNLPKLSIVEDNRPTKFVDAVNHVANSEVTFSGRDAPASTDSIYPKSVALPPEKKCAFKISVPEYAFELDDDVESNGLASKPLSEGKGKQETPLVNSKSDSSEELSQNKTADFPEINTPPGLLSKRTGEEASNGVNTGVKYGTEIEGSDLSLTGSKLESLSSATNHASGPTDAWPQLPVEDNSLKAGINGKLEASSVASTSTTTTTLFAAPFSNLSNGKFSPNPPLPSSSVLAESNSESHAITSISGEAAPSICAAPANVSMTSSVFGPSITKPGSSIFSSTTFSTSSTASNSETSDLTVTSEKIENGNSLGNLKNSSFASTSSAATNAIFGLNSSVMPTSTATQPQGSLFSTGGIVSAKALLPQSGNTTAHATEPFGSDSSGPTSTSSPESSQVGSSGTSPSNIFASGATSASSATTSSALPSNGVAAVTPSFGASSVAAAPETEALSPSIGTTPCFIEFQ